MQQTSMETAEVRGPVRYDEAFPKLPESQKPQHTSVAKASIPICVKSQHTREIIEIPNTERRTTENGNVMGNNKKIDTQRKVIYDISRQFGVDIDVNSSKSQTLTVILNGPANKIAEAKRAVVRELQTQSSLNIRVPSKFHRFIIGRQGATLRALEVDTTTRINVSNPSSAEPDLVVINGPKAGCELAKERILKLVDEQSKLGSERLLIPKIYHPFIRGPRQVNLTNWTRNYKVKIDIAPPLIPAEDICISGERNAVDIVVKEIKKIYEEAESKYKTITVKIPKAQHRLIFGPGGSGLADILAETGVSVELPQDDGNTVCLRGDPTFVGKALTMVCAKSESSVREDIVAPNRFHKLLIGRKGTALANLMEGYQERVRVDFVENKDRIELEGPKDDVEAIKERFSEKLKELEATMAITKIKVNSKYNGIVVGREGANIRKLKELYNVQISIIDGIGKMSEITIEGDPVSINKAAQAINDLVTKVENEKIKDMIIEPYLQQLLRTPINGSAPMRPIYDEFPNITIHWPETAKNKFLNVDPTSSVVQIQGQKKDVDGVAERLTKLLKQLKEANYHSEFRVYKEFRSHVFGIGAAEVRKILSDLQCRIQIPPADALPTTSNINSDSELIWIVGREKNVHEALDKIEIIQRKLANLKEIRVKVPSLLSAKVVGDKAPRLRSIKEQCDGVSFKFLRGADNNDLILSGPSDAVLKAEKLINDLNAKVAELCEEVIVHCDKKYHGYLIGRNGQNLVHFRNSHNVELLFPDKHESDPKLANEIRIVGNKSTVPKAKKDLETQVKAMEDEVELSISISSKHIRLINQAKRFHPALSRVRIIISKGSNVLASAITLDEDEEHQATHMNGHIDDQTEIKIIGPKAMAEAAKQALDLFKEDMKVAVTKTFPLTDKFHAKVLIRSKPQLPEWEVEYRVIIQVNVPPREQLNAMTNDDSQEFGALVIIGRESQIETVYEEKIRPLLPISEQFDIPREYHWNLVVNQQQYGRRDNNKARNESVIVNKVTELQQNCGVFIKLPPQVQTDANYITMHGTPNQLEEAKEQLNKWLKEWEEEKLDRIARSYEMEFEIAERFLSFIMKQKNRLCKNYDVTMRFPPVEKKVEEEHEVEDDENDAEDNALLVNDQNESESLQEENSVVPSNAPHLLLSEHAVKIVIRGYKEKVEEVKKEIDQLVDKIFSQVRECLNIPQEVHSQLIGSGRAGQLRIQKDFNVEIEFPGRNVQGVAKHIVVVMGDQNDVDSACDFLINKATDLLDRNEERRTRNNFGAQQNERRLTNNNNNKHGKKDFIVYGAPWNKNTGPIPNTGCHSDFPTMNGNNSH